MVKVIIAGGRDFNDYLLLKRRCDYLLGHLHNIEIVSGKQVTIDKETGEKYGADYLGERYAEEKGYSIKPFPADWNKHSRSAGPIRNREMAKYADCLIAFWDGNSSGTKNMIEEAEKEGLKIKVVKY